MADEVLISSSRCGTIETPPTLTGYYGGLLQYVSNLITASVSYAQQCYGNVEANQQECSIFVKKQIPQTIFRNISCPFPGKDRICISDTSNIRLDTGLIDSNDILGLNAAPQDRFKYRTVLECAPLRTDNYTRVITSGNATDGNSTIQLLYGIPNPDGSGIFAWPMHSPPFVNQYST